MSSRAELAALRLVKDSEEPAPLQEGFAEDLPGGLPIYRNPTIEGVESTWTELDSRSDRIQFKRGALAHVVSFNRVYGERNLEQLSGRMNASYSAVLDWQATYRRLLRLSDERRFRVLNLDVRFSHFRAMNGVADDQLYEAFLIRANKKRWSVGKLMDALHRYTQEAQALATQNEKIAEADHAIQVGAEETSDEPNDVAEYRESGSDLAEEPPRPAIVTTQELAAVGADYERDVIERFADWLQDGGLVLVDADGEVVPFKERVDEYARSAL